MKYDSVLITGSTGLIGAALVRSFASDGATVFAAARNTEKAEALYEKLPTKFLLAEPDVYEGL